MHNYEKPDKPTKVAKKVPNLPTVSKPEQWYQ